VWPLSVLARSPWAEARFLEAIRLKPEDAAPPSRDRAAGVYALCFDKEKALLLARDQAYKLSLADRDYLATRWDPSNRTATRVTAAEDIPRIAGEVFQGGAYNVILSFPAACPYKTRLAVVQELFGRVTGFIRISTNTEMAALGYAHYFVSAEERRDDKRGQFAVFIEPDNRYFAATAADIAGGVVRCVRSCGAEMRRDPDGKPDSPRDGTAEVTGRILRRATEDGGRIVKVDRIVLTATRHADKGSLQIIEELAGKEAPVSRVEDLIPMGLLVQVGIFQGATRDDLLLVVTPEAALGIVLPADALSEGELAGRGLIRSGAFLEIFGPSVTIPSERRCRVTLSESAEGPIRIVEKHHDHLLPIASIKAPESSDGRWPRSLTVTFDCDANMAFTVEIQDGEKRKLVSCRLKDVLER